MLTCHEDRTHLHVVLVWRTRRRVTHANLNCRRVFRRPVKIGFEQHETGWMVAEVLSHTWHVLHEGDIELFEMLFRADTRKHEQLRRVYRAAAQNHLVPEDLKYLAAALRLDADGAVFFK